jgi:hypothetical protein
MLEMVLRMAKENGLSARKPKRLTTVLRARIGDDPSTKIVVVRSIHEQRLIARGRPVYLIEFTYGLKQAFPKKEERKKWPHN